MTKQLIAEYNVMREALAVAEKWIAFDCDQLECTCDKSERFCSYCDSAEKVLGVIRTAVVCPIGTKKPILDRNTLTIKTHGHIQNEREKMLAFEREYAMRIRLDEALAENKQMADRLEQFQHRLVKATEQIDALNQAAIDGDDMPI